MHRFYLVGSRSHVIDLKIAHPQHEEELWPNRVGSGEREEVVEHNTHASSELSTSKEARIIL